MANLNLDEKSKNQLKVLGAVSLLTAIVIGVQVIPRGGSGVDPNTVVPTPVPESATTAAEPAPAGEAASAPAENAPAAAAAAPATGAPIAVVTKYREDPFVPKFAPFILPTPAPPPRPAPTPIPDVILPQPQDIMVSLPPADVRSSGAGWATSRVVLLPGTSARRPREELSSLPPVRISQVENRQILTRQPPPPPGQSRQVLSPSGNKRLSGIMIGDSVRALLEITTATETITRVVQPGDEIEGIRIVRIERITEGGRQQTRMIINEGGQERFVELKAAPQQAAGAPGGVPGGL